MGSSTARPGFWHVCLGAAGALLVGCLPTAAQPSKWPDAIPSSGGQYFAKRVELHVPAFVQDDPRWGGDHLGPTTDTLADEGCTLTSVVMVLNFYGIKTDPARFNRYLNSHMGYDDEGLLAFARVPTYAPQIIRLAYQGPSSYALLDKNLLAGHPIIAQVTLPDGGTHFVVVAGKNGFDYLVRDPAGYVSDSVVPLSGITSHIDREFLFVPNS